jgi:hypothetical protein
MAGGHLASMITPSRLLELMVRDNLRLVLAAGRHDLQDRDGSLRAGDVPFVAVNMLLEQGLITRIDDPGWSVQGSGMDIYLPTAEGRRLARAQPPAAPDPGPA